ncbi:hypothetical protein BH24ACT15_BH24ACT15_31240 [soil metagenome]|jgi:hypothetical protein
MSVGQAERVADRHEVSQHARAIRQTLSREGLDNPRVTADGTVVLHSPTPSLLTLGKVTTQLRTIVGHHVRVFFDTNPAAAGWETTAL